MKRFIRLFVVVTAAVVFAARAQVVAAGVGEPPVFTDDYFCMHAHSHEDYEKVFSLASFGLFRTWDSSIGWPRIEPRKGEWDWTLLDNFVQHVRARGGKVILTLAMTPPWAAKNPDAPSPYGGWSSSPPRDIEDWKDYVRAVAERNKEVYGGAIKYWEIWNEPDNVQKGYAFYTGTVDELAEMGRTAREILKRVDSGNEVVSPGITQMGREWLGAYLKSGGCESSDIIGFHFYWDWYSPRISDFEVAMTNVREAMARGGCGDKPVWVTETGFNVNHFKTRPERDAALAAMLIAPLNAGAGATCAYSWNNSIFTAMYDEKLKRTTDTFVAYEQLYKWLRGARLESFGPAGSKLRECVLSRDGKAARLIWRTAPGRVRYDTGASGKMRVHRLDGSVSEVSPGDGVMIDADPVLLENSDYLGAK